MKFYLVEADPHFLVTDKQVAKAQARERGCGWSPHDIPTDKGGIMEYVNSLMERASAQAHIELTGTVEGHEKPAKASEPVDPSFAVHAAKARTADEICDFILNEAKVFQVENIMAAIGTRIAELAKEHRA